MEITIRAFEESDIQKKVEWINNPENNAFLHYDIPITVSGTKKWFNSHIGDKNRYDAVILADGTPVGTIGLLNIDYKSMKAEFYIAMGETEYKRKGIAKQAGFLIIKYAFDHYGLNKVYLFTESENIPAQKLFESLGFIKEGYLRQDIISHGIYVDRVAYGLIKEDWDK